MLTKCKNIYSKSNRHVIEFTGKPLITVITFNPVKHNVSTQIALNKNGISLSTFFFNFSCFFFLTSSCFEDPGILPTEIFLFP